MGIGLNPAPGAGGGGGGASEQLVLLGSGSAGSPSGMFFRPLTLLPDTGGDAAGAQAVITILAVDVIEVRARVDETVPIGYAELFVRSLDGSQALGIEADAGTALVDGETVDWTGGSTFGAVGDDLSYSANAIHSAAGGTFIVTFIAYPAA